MGWQDTFVLLGEKGRLALYCLMARRDSSSDVRSAICPIAGA
jgi:hypothetical protein